MNKVVYFLGAGFSAPLGLPVMTNFLIKSKDMYFSDPSRFEHFSIVLKKITEMSVCKNYYETDLFNIEEILSILEMRQQIDGPTTQAAFVKYLIDVIVHFTPAIKPHNGNFPANWHSHAFDSQIQQAYGYFVASLLNLSLEIGLFNDEASHPPQQTKVLIAKRQTAPQTSYSIITLNYDLVIEDFAKCFSEQFKGGRLRFVLDEDEEQDNMPLLSKLHGSIHLGKIVPPTWNKALNPKSVLPWQRAFSLLKSANHIRIIGYSLPTADSYIKYLLKAAAIESPHLKAIDVLCMDGNGKVKNRYDEFINFNKNRFVNGNVVDYLNLHNEELVKPFENPPWDVPMVCDKLEDFHERFFEKRKLK